MENPNEATVKLDSLLSNNKNSVKTEKILFFPFKLMGDTNTIESLKTHLKTIKIKFA